MAGSEKTGPGARGGAEAIVVSACVVTGATTGAADGT